MLRASSARTMAEKKRPPLPPSLQNLLTITNPDGTPRTTKVTPSPLMSRLQHFLPEMAAANARLSPKAGEDSVSIQKIEPQKSADALNEIVKNDGKCKIPLQEEGQRETDPKRKDGNVGESAVMMDLYVDESLGELVSSGEQEGPGATKVQTGTPLVEIFSPPKSPTAK